jgi:hypothetical protein
VRYLRIDVGSWPESDLPTWQSRLESVLRRVLPSSSPDLEHFYSQAAHWWLEIDDAGLPVREIGFHDDGTPIVIGPVGDNIGFLIDSSDDWSHSTEDSDEAAEGFERAWNEVRPRFQHLETSE